MCVRPVPRSNDHINFLITLRGVANKKKGLPWKLRNTYKILFTNLTKFLVKYKIITKIFSSVIQIISFTSLRVKIIQENNFRSSSTSDSVCLFFCLSVVLSVVLSVCLYTVSLSSFTVGFIPPLPTPLCPNLFSYLFSPSHIHLPL